MPVEPISIEAAYITIFDIVIDDIFSLLYGRIMVCNLYTIITYFALKFKKKNTSL